MTTHRFPIRGDRASCCGVPVDKLPHVDDLVPDCDTPTCGLPVVDTGGEPAPRAA